MTVDVRLNETRFQRLPMAAKSDIIQPCDWPTWPQAWCPASRRWFTPAFLYHAGGGYFWTISTEADRRGRLAGSVGFNPAAEPMWIAVLVDNEAGAVGAG